MTDTSEAVTRKIERLRAGKPPRVLDLFAGCGGMSLGFIRAGFQSVGGIEKDPDAARTFAFNIHPENEALHSIPRDVTDDSATLLADLTDDDLDAAVDVIIGGPPCPTYSRIGRAKLNFPHNPHKVNKEEFKQKDLFLLDPRNGLYTKFLEHVENLAPLAVVMENVPEFLNQGGENHGENASDQLEAMGYSVGYTLLNAAAYGVPQWRERFFLIALRKELGISVPTFPVPTRDIEHLPRGMHVNRKAALHKIPSWLHDNADQGLLFRHERWVPTPRPTDQAPGPTTAGEALADLPEYAAHTSKAKRKPQGYWKEIDEISYREDETTEYGTLMRSWPGFSTDEKFCRHHHLARHTTPDTHRDINIFRKMQPGDEYPAAIEIAKRNFADSVKSLETSTSGPISDIRQDVVRAACIPPYDVSKFRNKWWMVDPESPARTLTAHLSKDSYSHIHFDKNQARMITVQEAARLQSFPDGFLFRCTLGPALRQVGNSVPPLLALRIAQALRTQLDPVACSSATE